MVVVLAVSSLSLAFSFSLAGSLSPLSLSLLSPLFFASLSLPPLSLSLPSLSHSLSLSRARSLRLSLAHALSLKNPSEQVRAGKDFRASSKWGLALSPSLALVIKRARSLNPHL